MASPKDPHDNALSSWTTGSHPYKRIKRCDTEKDLITTMIDACTRGDISLVRELIALEKNENSNDAPNGGFTPLTVVSQQDEETGLSPLMVASRAGHIDICNILLEEGAPWNAIDRMGQCAGNYATDAQHWDIVNLLVDAGVRAELVLGASIRLQMQRSSISSEDSTTPDEKEDGSIDQSCLSRPAEHEPCTKPDYLERNVRYNSDGTALLDDDDDAVMMEWERPLMIAHANIVTSNGMSGKRVLNVGFGMGIIDSALQKLDPMLHVIVEAHPLVYQKMIADGWNEKQNVRICFGRWQDVLPTLIREEKISFDGIFYDTYGEHFTDLEDFHQDIVANCLADDGVYSFFNGLAPDSLFFHGVGEFLHSFLYSMS